MTPAGTPGDLEPLLHAFPSRSIRSAPLVLHTGGQSSYGCTTCAHVRKCVVRGSQGDGVTKQSANCVLTGQAKKLCFNWCKQHQQMYQSSGQGCHTIMSHAEHSPQRKESLTPEKLSRVAWRVRVIAARALRATPFYVPPPPRGTGALSWGLYFPCSFWVFVLILTPSLFSFTAFLVELQVES